MESSTPHEIILTDEHLTFIRKTVLANAKRLAKYIDRDDLLQHVTHHAIREAQKFNATRGASFTTFLFLVVRTGMSKYLTRERERCEIAQPYKGDVHDEIVRPKPLAFESPSFMDYIDDDETRKMCFLMMEHDNNQSEVARCMNVTEGTIRYRLDLLRGKLRAAGFDPFAEVK